MGTEIILENGVVSENYLKQQKYSHRRYIILENGDGEVLDSYNVTDQVFPSTLAPFDNLGLVTVIPKETYTMQQQQNELLRWNIKNTVNGILKGGRSKEMAIAQLQELISDQKQDTIMTKD